MKKSLSIIALLLVAVMLLVSCGGGDKPVETADPGTETTEAGEADPGTETDAPEEVDPEVEEPGEPVTLRLAVTQSVTTFNPNTAEHAVEYENQKWVNANLYKRIYDEELQDGRWEPEAADGEPIDVNGDGKTWNVNLKQDIFFEDGTPIDANVVEYSMKMALDPKLASRNSSIGGLLENGDAYLTGEVENWEDVGCKVVDEFTIQFIIEDTYVPYTEEDLMLGLNHVGAALVHPEMFESCFNEDRTENTYGTSVDRFVAGGAYKITNYIDGQFLEITKREEGSSLLDYYTVDVLQLNVVSENNTALQMYKNGELDAVVANTEEYDDYPDVYYLYTPDNYGIFINSESTTNPVLQDKNLRYAIYWGFDRETCLSMSMPTNKVNPYHYSSLVKTPDPSDPLEYVTMREQPESKAIRMDGHELTETGFDPELAEEYFVKAYEANGSQKITVEMQYSEGSDSIKAWAEAIQWQFNQLFGADRFEMTLRAVPHATIYENMNRYGDLPYDMSCTAGIYQDIKAPWDNSNWVYSGEDVYSTQYTLLGADAAAEWDKLYYECTSGIYKGNDKESLQGKIKNCARMEEILLNEATFIPAYSRGNRYLINEDIDILMNDNIGDAYQYIYFALMQARYN